MARNRTYKAGVALNAIGKFGEGFLQGVDKRKELEQLIAQREYQRQRDEMERELTKRAQDISLAEKASGQTIIGQDGRVYQSSGMQPEYLQRFGFNPVSTSLPGATQTGPGKLTVQKPSPEPSKTLILSPEEARNRSGETLRNTRVTIAPDVKTNRGATPAQQAALYTTKELVKQYIQNGSLTKEQGQLLADASQNLDINLIPEQDAGLFHTVDEIKQKLGLATYHPAVVTPQLDSGSTSGVKNEITRVMPNGKVAVFDKTSKKFLRYK